MKHNVTIDFTQVFYDKFNDMEFKLNASVLVFSYKN